MSIQSNINQIISVAGILASQNPSLREKAARKAEIRDLENELSANVGALKEHIKKDTSSKVTDQTADPEEAQRIITSNWEELVSRHEEIRDTAEKLYKKDPTKERLEVYRNARDISAEQRTEFDKFMATFKKAEESLEIAQEEKRTARRNFMDYLKDEPTSLGGTVGELDEKLQKEIKKQYSSKDRKSMMDRKDKEREQE